jgi:hypothetical protein
VHEGELHTTLDPTTSKLHVTIPGKVSLPVVKNKCFAFCMKTLRIGPNGRVPLSLFARDMSPGAGLPFVIKSVDFDNVGVEFGKVEAPMILAGKDGAVLEKVAAGFRLTKGRAYLCQAEP